MSSSSTSGTSKVVENVFRTATEDSFSSSSPSSSTAASSSSSSPSPHAYDVRQWSKSKALNTMRLCNCCNGCCLIIGAVVAFLIPTGTLFPTAATVTLAAYVILLGILMMCAECNLAMLQRRLRNNFGFMFTYIGRAMYIFFTATVAVALGNQSNYLMWSIGGFTVLNSILNAIIIFSHPSFKSGEISRDADPSQLSATAEHAVQSYILANPQMAAQVITGGIGAAVVTTSTSGTVPSTTNTSHIPASFLASIMGDTNKPPSSSSESSSSSTNVVPSNHRGTRVAIAMASGNNSTPTTTNNHHDPNHTQHNNNNASSTSVPTGAQYNPFGNNSSSSYASSLPPTLPPARPLGTTNTTPSNSTATYNPFHRVSSSSTTPSSTVVTGNNQTSHSNNNSNGNGIPIRSELPSSSQPAEAEDEGENPFL